MHDLKKNGTVFISFQRKQFVLSYSNSNYSKLKIFVSIHTCEIIPDNSMKIQSLDHFFLFFFLIKSNAHDTFFFFYMNRDVIFFFPHFRDVETPVQVFDVKKKKKKFVFPWQIIFKETIIRMPNATFTVWKEWDN